jgi:cytochrome c oxidase accessory protein FixG
MNAPERIIKMYAPREAIHPRETQGHYTRLRWLCVWLTQIAFYAAPWLQWNGRQALLFDLAARKFYIFGLVLWPQDFIYLAVLLIICAYSLFLVTAVAGRVWCGFACPQTVYTEIFLWLERRWEGPRSARLRLDKQGWTFDKVWRRGGKHLSWGLVGLWTGFTFVGYFTPIRVLGELHFGPWEWFWVLFYSFATYGNAGWLREQVCRYMCPYARFQSSMFDRDTLIVTYDAQRGEPRVPLGKEGGSCIDCSMCVQVCPAGIDIRKGLQYECISCAVCIDACDSVMDKVKRPRGLIHYATGNGKVAGWRSLLRPRILVYSAVLGLIISAFGTALWLRTPLKMDVLRDRGAMGREVEDGAIENVYRLQIMNTTEQPHRYRITVSGLPTLAPVTDDVVAVGATETLAVPLRLRVAAGAGQRGSNRVAIALTALDDPALHVQEEAVFIVPRR